MNKLKVVTVLGTRPEIIRLSVIIKKFDQFFDHTLVHTGQNYDYTLNEIFFEELEIRKPDFFLEVVGQDLGETMGNVLSKSYKLFSELKPDALLVLGDTNSALCTISAKRLKIPIFHMEAGNRCFDQNVPEELNRKIADHTSDINLTYTENSRRYLLAEGFRKDHVFCIGSPLKEVLDFYSDQINGSLILEKLQLNKEKYIVASIHREENLDIGDNFKNIIDALNKVVDLYDAQLIFSTHPRTKKKIEQLNLKISSRISFVEPLGFCDYVFLQKNALITLSDSGTISEESTILGFKAVSIRTSTERPEAIDHGNIVLGDISSENIINSINITLGLNDRLDPPFEYLKTDNSNTVLKLIQSYTPIINREIWRK
ncbi:UDP-N-acetylglucosamine 2-epimerase (non-hydrolyzing) [Flavobacteriaceae bacterium]|nr:UDP-N-acetylglucosamine 2-epimerase (non-hydrolyzing) [Flavobacteriaceae bacterium]